MKAPYLMLTTFLLATSALASPVPSIKKSINVARLVKLTTLVAKPGLQVSVAVEDLGGSTDVSPTQVAYLTLYSKGEMYSTDATFELGQFYAVKSASRTEAGIYEVVATDASTMSDVTLKIDARNATAAIQKVKCEDFDCPASENFSSIIDVTIR